MTSLPSTYLILCEYLFAGYPSINNFINVYVQWSLVILVILVFLCLSNAIFVHYIGKIKSHISEIYNSWLVDHLIMRWISILPNCGHALDFSSITLICYNCGCCRQLTSLRMLNGTLKTYLFISISRWKYGLYSTYRNTPLRQVVLLRFHVLIPDYRVVPEYFVRNITREIIYSNNWSLLL
jgi:hypothetical protein